MPMFPVYVTLLCVIIGVIYSYRESKWLGDNEIPAMIAGGVTGLVVGVMISFFAWIFNPFIPSMIMIEPKDTPIMTVPSKSSPSGYYTVGSGIINGEMKYSYFLKDKTNQFVPAVGSTIVDSDTSFLRQYVTVRRENGLLEHLFGHDNLHPQTQNEFHIPPGTFVPNVVLEFK